MVCPTIVRKVIWAFSDSKRFLRKEFEVSYGCIVFPRQHESRIRDSNLENIQFLEFIEHLVKHILPKPISHRDFAPFVAREFEVGRVGQVGERKSRELFLA